MPWSLHFNPDGSARHDPADPITEALDILFYARHHLEPDTLRSLQNIYLCASAARYGEPHEAGWVEDAEFYATHDVAECEAPPPDEDLDSLAEETAREWFEREQQFAADAHELTPDLVGRISAIFTECGPTEEQYARAAQLIACRRNTCGGPDAGHDHIALPKAARPPG